MPVTSVRLQPEVDTGLHAISGKLQRSKNWLINQALKEFIERQQTEQSRWLQTTHAIDAIAEGKVVSGEAVHEWLQSWGHDKEIATPKADK